MAFKLSREVLMQAREDIASELRFSYFESWADTRRDLTPEEWYRVCELLEQYAFDFQEPDLSNESRPVRQAFHGLYGPISTTIMKQLKGHIYGQKKSDSYQKKPVKKGLSIDMERSRTEWNRKAGSGGADAPQPPSQPDVDLDDPDASL